MYGVRKAAFLYTHNEISERKSTKITSFKIASKKKKKNLTNKPDQEDEILICSEPQNIDKEN